MRYGLLGACSLCELLEGFVAGQQTVWRTRHTPPRPHRQRRTTNLADATAHQNPIVNGVMCRSAAAPVADEGDATASRTLSGQPLGVILTGLALSAETWDENDHGCEGMPRNRYPPKAHDSAAPPSLLSIRIHAEKEAHPVRFPIGR
jgi:hypothetical protein